LYFNLIKQQLHGLNFNAVIRDIYKLLRKTRQRIRSILRYESRPFDGSTASIVENARLYESCSPAKSSSVLSLLFFDNYQHPRTGESFNKHMTTYIRHHAQVTKFKKIDFPDWLVGGYKEKWSSLHHEVSESKQTYINKTEHGM
jgi:hypothetical protein